jgi:hypothetical protein
MTKKRKAAADAPGTLKNPSYPKKFKSESARLQARYNELCGPVETRKIEPEKLDD